MARRKTKKSPRRSALRGRVAKGTRAPSRPSARRKTAKVARRRKAAARGKATVRRRVARAKVVRRLSKKSVKRTAAVRKVTRRKKVARPKAVTRPKVVAQPKAAARKRPVTAKPATPVVAVAATSKPPVSRVRRRSIPRRAPSLDRARRVVLGEDIVSTPPSSLDFDRTASAARSGRRELRERLNEHTETGPVMTGGDIDADWESAYSVGDEAPGGDNPTPDQDLVDDIGLAVGVQYEDNEELKGEAKIAERDRHRWELDPASSDDYEDR